MFIVTNLNYYHDKLLFLIINGQSAFLVLRLRIVAFV